MQVLSFYIYIFAIVLFVIFNIYIWHAIWVGRSGKRPPYMPAPKIVREAIVEQVGMLLEKSKKSLTVIDPGCGSGTLLIPLARKFPNHKFWGVEISAYPLWIAKIFSKGLKNLELVHDDMFNHSFAKADVIVIFGVKGFMPLVSKKILEDVKKKCFIFSAAEELPKIKLKEKLILKGRLIEIPLYVYETN